MNLREIAEKIAEIKEFGDVPSYGVEADRKYVYVCRNNGQFHRGDARGMGGWATFIGKFTADEAVQNFLLEGI